MKKSNLLKSTLAVSVLWACSGAVLAAQTDTALAAAGDAAAGLDVTMTVLPDSPSLPDAVAGVINLPATAASQAEAHARGASSTATAATAAVGAEHPGAVGVDESADGSLNVGGELGNAGGALGADAGISADINAGADLGADISHDSQDIGGQLGGGIGGELGAGLKLH